jgi:purine-nucleoside phosphorylase
MDKLGCVGLVAGSGIDLTQVLDTVEERLPFAEFPGMPEGSVAGHAREFVIGRCGNTRVVVQCGRIHVYEGFDFEAVTAPVRAQRELGVDTIVFTNAAGGFNPVYPPASLLAIDRIVTWPFCRFTLPHEVTPDFTIPECDTSGTYFWMHGPCYETRAEVQALKNLGAAAVGMSVAPELRCAQSLGMRGAVISCITNICGADEILAHDHVLDAAQVASPRLTRLIMTWLETLR